MHALTVFLASASPRRREILSGLGHRVIVRPVDVDERERGGESPEAYLSRVVSSKLEAARALAWPQGADLLLVADTVVTLGDLGDPHPHPQSSILHKPQNDADGTRMLRALSGRSHVVTTRFAVASHAGRTQAESVATRVAFRALHDDEIAAYLLSGEGHDKAGGYAIQGRASAFITRIEGSYGAVVGLPAAEVTVAFRKLMTTAVL